MSYSILPDFSENAWINPVLYEEMYASSLKTPQQFWGDEADKFLTWFKRYDEVLTGSFAEANVRWFQNGKLNACYNCVDRHLATRGQQIAVIWEGDDPAQSKKLTYAEFTRRSVSCC